MAASSRRRSLTVIDVARLYGLPFQPGNSGPPPAEPLSANRQRPYCRFLKMGLWLNTATKTVDHQKEMIVKSRILFYTVLLLLVSACATPQIQELRSTPSNEQFTVHAPLECLYGKGVEHVSSYIGMIEPKFTWYLAPNRQYAWFRQPLTLIELETKPNNFTEVRRSQTPSAQFSGQGDDLIEFLKSNPCVVQK